MGIQHGVVTHRLEGRQPDDAAVAVGIAHLAHEAHDLRRAACPGGGAGGGQPLGFVRIGIQRRIEGPRRVQMRGVHLDPAVRRGAPHEGRAADVGQRADVLSGRQAMGDLADLPLGIAVDQQVRTGIEQHRAPCLVRPVVVVRDPAQRRLDAADHDRDVAEGLARALRIDDHGPVRALSRRAIRRVGIVAADPPVRGVAIDHRVHVSGGDAKDQVRPAEPRKRGGVRPVRLSDDADPESLRLQHAADDRHAETRVVDVRVARPDDHVAAVPAERVHFRPRRGQERRHAEPAGPVLAVGEELARGLHRGILAGSRRRSRGGPSSAGRLEPVGDAGDAGQQRLEQGRVAASAGAPSPQQVHLHVVHGIEVG